MTIKGLFKAGMDRDIPTPRDFAPGVILDLGAGDTKHFHGAVRLTLPLWDGDKDPIPFDDNTVGGIHCYNFLEHLYDPRKVLREIERVLVPGGVCNVVVPYYNSQAQAMDLDHKGHTFCEDTWKNLFRNGYFHTGDKWRLREELNIIIGVVERNLCLMTQLVKE